MTLTDIKNLIIRSEYQVSGKILDAMDAGEFVYEDLECCIETASEITKRERDEHGESVDGYKYTIIGRNLSGDRFYTAGKVRLDTTGSYYFFITAHEAD